MHSHACSLRFDRILLLFFCFNQDYVGTLAQLDASIGRLRQMLITNGVANNTMLLFTSGPVRLCQARSGFVKSKVKGQRSGQISCQVRSGQMSGPVHVPTAFSLSFLCNFSPRVSACPRTSIVLELAEVIFTVVAHTPFSHWQRHTYFICVIR